MYIWQCDTSIDSLYIACQPHHMQALLLVAQASVTMLCNKCTSLLTWERLGYLVFMRSVVSSHLNRVDNLCYKLLVVDVLKLCFPGFCCFVSIINSGLGPRSGSKMANSR